MTSLMKTNIESYINCLKKLKDCEKKFEENMDNDMKKTNLLNYEVSIESLVKVAQQQLIGFKDRVKKMEDVLNRKDVVITIFGSVSVGKSCLLNVLLNDEIFWSASAHSTSCFVTVTKGDDNCLMYRDEKISFNNVSDMKNKIDELTSDLSETRNALQNDEMLQIFIKETSKSILKKGVLIMDTPGADRNMNINNIIKDQSQNSDIFIFMLPNNITEEHRFFFNYQTETSVRPDIFILVNKWDNSDRDREHLTERSKLSITEDCLKFIRKQKGGNEQDIESQIYFISTTEALDIRTNLQKYQNLTQKQQQRNDEFLKFEKKLQEYINNPEENKGRRYKSDIEDLNKKIDEIISKFRIKFKLWMENSDYILNCLFKLKVDIEELKNNLNTNMIAEIEKLNISGLLICSDNVNDMNAAFKKCCDIIEEKLSELDKDCELKILYFFENIENSDSISKGNFKNFSKIRMETQLSLRESSPSNLNLVGEVLPIVKPYFDSLKGLAISSIVVGAVALYTKLSDDAKKEENDKNNKAEVNRTVEQLKVKVDSARKEIYTHYESIINNICKKFDKSKIYWEDYIRELNKIVFELS